MDALTIRVCEHIKESELILPGESVVAGISGGADSMCLLYVLLGLRGPMKISVTAVHVNHCIRGEEADADEDYVRGICEKEGVPFVSFREDITGRAREQHLSVEEAGRIARYECFEKVRLEKGADRIAVAHNMDDLCETVLLNLARGSGVRGMAGMPAKRGYIVRPLLRTGREEIEEYDRRNNIAFRTDRTNLEREYARNRIRLDVLPYLCRNINSRSREHIAEMAAMAGDLAAHAAASAEEAAKEAVREETGRIFIDIEKLESLDAAVSQELIRQQVCRAAGRMKDIGAVHYRSVMKLAHLETGKAADLPYGLMAEKRYGEICIRKREEAAPVETEITVPGEYPLAGGGSMAFAMIPYSGTEQIPRNKYTKWFDYGKICYGLCLRNRKEGDYMSLSGQHKKLSRVLIDGKVPKGERDSMIFLADGGHILWIPDTGRISDDYKVSERTQYVLEAKYFLSGDEGFE
ncbi:MAG: tRNA lysidine(34) synthetase TilS [Lachnospiraceae bacterium]|nr:tRNA lysidine(34) synthetase TilS [Lachnospiraceae bacterium]